jgi:hypothetical protein
MHLTETLHSMTIKKKRNFHLIGVKLNYFELIEKKKERKFETLKEDDSEKNIYLLSSFERDRN